MSQNFKKFLDQNYSRAEFLGFLGKSGAALASHTALGGLATSLLSSCATTGPSRLKPLADDVTLMKGLNYNVVLEWGQALNSKSDRYGFSNDFIAHRPLSEEPGRSVFLINHESISSLFVSNRKKDVPPSKEDVELESQEVGFSLVVMEKDSRGRWSLVFDHPYNKRIDANTKIPFAGGVKVAGRDWARGTLANCAGGQSDWGSFFSCEENYDNFFGDREDPKGSISKDKHQWRIFRKDPPEHYGWVVECDPILGSAQKLTSLGRFKHEGATFTRSKAGFPVVYMGDDEANEHLYKFVSSSRNSLEEGELFVASLEKKSWLSLSRQSHPKLKERFKNQLEIQIYTRQAARIVGATPLDRPEDVEVDPQTGNVFVALTNNKKRLNAHGSILKIAPTGSDHGSQTFEYSNFAAGGSSSGFSSPDNLCFDPSGFLWMTNDVSESLMGRTLWTSFPRNSLYLIPLRGSQAGRVVEVAQAPPDAEFTGPSLAPDGKSIFVCVQHPGSRSTDRSNLSSHWPRGAPNIPRPSMIEIYGDRLAQLRNLS